MKNFDWGNSNEWFKSCVTNEIFENRIYEKYVQVEENDIVFDAGASIGVFGYSVLNKHPSIIYCVEPSPQEFETLKNNIPKNIGKFLNYGISKEDGYTELNDVYTYNVDQHLKPNMFETKKFKTIIEENSIKKIDFLKTDCEGGEYDIFNIENICWIKENVKKISGEWHLSNPELNQKFRVFRDVYLRIFDRYEIFSVDGIDIKWDLWNEHFLNYYSEIIIHIDNR